MAFKSAELKKLYEQLQDLGKPISAHKAAQLFARGELADVVRKAIDEKNARQVPPQLPDPNLADQARKLKTAYQTAFSNLIQAQQDLNKANDQAAAQHRIIDAQSRRVDELQKAYDYYASALDNYNRNRWKLANLQEQADKIKAKIAYLADKLTEEREAYHRIASRASQQAAQIPALQSAVDQAAQDLQNAKYWLDVCNKHYGVGAFQCDNQLQKAHDAQSAYDQAVTNLTAAKNNAPADSDELQRIRNGIAQDQQTLNSLQSQLDSIQATIFSISGALLTREELQNSLDQLANLLNTAKIRLYNYNRHLQEIQDSISIAQLSVNSAKHRFDDARKAWNDFKTAHPDIANSI